MSKFDCDHDHDPIIVSSPILSTTVDRFTTNTGASFIFRRLLTHFCFFALFTIDGPLGIRPCLLKSDPFMRRYLYIDIDAIDSITFKFGAIDTFVAIDTLVAIPLWSRYFCDLDLDLRYLFIISRSLYFLFLI